MKKCDVCGGEIRIIYHCDKCSEIINNKLAEMLGIRKPTKEELDK